MSTRRRVRASRRRRHHGALSALCLVLAGAIFSAVVVLLAPSAQAQAPPDRANVSFQKGISFVANWSEEYDTPGSDRSMDQLSWTGANWISLIVTGHQQTYTSTTIDRTHPSTPTDTDLVHAIQTAHDLGLRVMLKPHLDLFDESGGHWRGDIGPGFTNESQWAAWFASYKDFIWHYAWLAQVNGVEQFCIGSELVGTSDRVDDWWAVATGVRGLYSGPITYAAAQGSEEISIWWWDALDYIGVNAYYPVNADIGISPTTEQLEANWLTPRTQLAALASQWGRRVIFTEIGYRSQRGTTAHPWDGYTVSEIDQEEQANAYEAAFRQFFYQPWMAGIFWHSWPVDRFASGTCDDGYSPHRKLAENVLRSWYGAAPMPNGLARTADAGNTSTIYGDVLASGWITISWSAPLVDLAAAEPVYTGTNSVAVQLDPWGALSFWHWDVDVGDYYWLEFQIRGPFTATQHLVAYVSTADGENQDFVPVDNCYFIDGGTIEGISWKQVRIPLRELNRSNQPIRQITLWDQSSSGSTFWIDEMRFVGAQPAPYRLSLPIVGG